MYATQDDIVDRYGEDELLTVADRDGDDTVDAAVVSQALQDATDEIDTYVGSRYSLPLPTQPTALKRICVDIALYRLSTESGLTEEKRKRYEDAVKFLLGIAKGDIKLGLPEPNGGPVTVEISGPDRRFNRRNMNRLL